MIAGPKARVTALSLTGVRAVITARQMTTPTSYTAWGGLGRSNDELQGVSYSRVLDSGGDMGLSHAQSAHAVRSLTLQELAVSRRGGRLWALRV